MAEEQELEGFWILMREALTRRAAAHPDDDELLSYLLDELPVERAEVLEQHLAGCELCQETVRRLGGRGGMRHDRARELVTAVLRCESSAMTAEEIARVLRDKGRPASHDQVETALSSLLAEGLLASEREARQLRYRLALPPDLPCEVPEELEASEPGVLSELLEEAEEEE